MPRRVREGAQSAAEKATKVPGANRVGDAASKGIAMAASGAGKFVSRSGRVALRPKDTMRAFQRKGHLTDQLIDIRALDLSVVDDVAKFQRWTHAYAGVVGAQGAAAGLALTGGEAVAATGGVAGAGAGAAPGVGVIAATLALDSTALLTLSSRLVAKIAMAYGFDPRQPAEEVFLLSVISLGTASSQGAKLAAYRELTQLTAELARSQTWAILNQHVVARVARKFAKEFAEKELTKKQLGMLLPLAGIAIGAGANYYSVDRIGNAAYWAYRERFLLDKLGDEHASSGPGGTVADGARATDVIEPVIDLLSLIDESIAEDHEAGPD